MDEQVPRHKHSRMWDGGPIDFENNQHNHSTDAEGGKLDPGAISDTMVFLALGEEEAFS